ncbi:MAG: GNAT family N-acetyltransferase [Kiritimatiellae bacterium]|nr:GNAT family N-acetyltransferase [Kiritimatiellia bacterium]
MSRAVLVLFNEPLGRPGGVESDAGILREVDAVCNAFKKLGLPYRRIGVRTLQDVGSALQHAPERRVVNLVESLGGSATEACLVPAVCASLGKTWTGSGTACQLLALDKWLSKCALKAAGVPVPEAVLIPPGAAATRGAPSPPLIVKPLCADASEGIDATSVIRTGDPKALQAKVEQIHADFGQQALVEAYVEGREFNVSILERDGQPIVLPLAEIDFSTFGSDRPRIVDYRAKWIEDSFEFTNTPRRIPADIDEASAECIRAAALSAWNALGCRHYARIDMRVNAHGNPFVIEVNPNPDISPDAGFTAALHAAGIEFEDFVKSLIIGSGCAIENGPPSPPCRIGRRRIAVRRSLPEDAQPIQAFLQDIGIFELYELDVAREVLEEALDENEGGHYQSYTAAIGRAVAGWACVGPTPCTEGTFDLYWLAVSPDYSRRGAAAALLAEVERRIRDAKGRLIVVETSSRPNYKPARRFYERKNYHLAATVADFYRRGDDKLIYLKTL